MSSCDVKVNVSNLVTYLDWTSIVSGMWLGVDLRTYIKMTCGEKPLNYVLKIG